MVGLSGIVVKSHGRADGVAFARAIGTAVLAARRGLMSHIAQALQAEGAVN
jgi:glycerol-3-phosphate acyltransferase PlsX